MTVKQLKKIINKYPDDLLVVLSSDSEGNSFSQLYHLETNNIGILNNSDVSGNDTDEALVLYPTR